MTMDPSWTAQIDQMIAGARDLGKASAAYYRSVLAEGVPEPSAVALTVGWLRAVLSMPRQDDPDAE